MNIEPQARASGYAAGSVGKLAHFVSKAACSALQNQAKRAIEALKGGGKKIQATATSIASHITKIVNDNRGIEVKYKSLVIESLLEFVRNPLPVANSYSSALENWMCGGRGSCQIKKVE